MSNLPSDHDQANASAATENRKLATACVALMVLALTGLSLWHIQLVQFFCDDSYISFRYAKNFTDGLGLVYNAGERVEGYTNFLWVMILALGFKLGLSAEAWSLGVGILLLLATMALCTLWASRLFPGRRVLRFLPALLLASFGPAVLWAVCGLETICYTAFTVAAMIVYGRSFWSKQPGRTLLASGILYALSTMVRPDGVMFGGVAGVHLITTLLIRRVQVGTLIRKSCFLAIGFFAIFAPFMLWRLYYYRDWLPNTFYVKSGSAISVELGSQYLISFTQSYPALWLLFVSGAMLALFQQRYRQQRLEFSHILLAVAGFVGYILWAGGDYMALYRFIAPLAPLIVLVACVPLDFSFHLLSTRGYAKPVWTLPAAALIVAGLCAWSTVPSIESCNSESPTSFINSVTNMRRNSERWVMAGKTLKRDLWSDAVISTTAAGAIPYYSEHQTIDQSGLCDRYTSKVESDPWLLDRPGHMKQATRSYLAERNPDVIIWHPTIRQRGRMPPGRPPTDQYLARALPIDGLVDQEGNDLFLYFWLRGDLALQGDQAGMLIPGRF